MQGIEGELQERWRQDLRLSMILWTIYFLYMKIHLQLSVNVKRKKKEPAQAGTQYETKLFTLEAHIPSLMSRKQHSYDSDNADE